MSDVLTVLSWLAGFGLVAAGVFGVIAALNRDNPTF